MATPLTLDPAAFDPASIPGNTKAFDAKFREILAQDTTKWWQVGAVEHRRRRRAGELSRPAPTLLDSAERFEIPSRDAGRVIPCRVLKPQNGKATRAVYMHIHGGGWVLGDEESQDPRLQDIANDHGLLCISIGYRLAPEHPYPAGPNDCYDAAEWLVVNAESTFGAALGFVSGDSAGGHLSMLVALHLLQHSDKRFADFRFKGLIPHFGCFSMNFTPTARTMENHEKGLLLTYEDGERFRDAFLPGWSKEAIEKPEVSPLYADLEALRGKLPPALFTCGTKDILLDDSLFMSAKWAAAGGEARLEIVPGAQHGYVNFPRDIVGCGSEQGMVAVDKFITEKL